MPAVFGSVMASAFIGLLITPFFAQVIRFFPPVVTGVVITTIGLSLMPVAANWAMGGNAKAPDYGSMANIGLAGFTCSSCSSSAGEHPAISRLSILLAIVVGTIVATIVGMANFSATSGRAGRRLPDPVRVRRCRPSRRRRSSRWSIVVLVIMTETTADILAVGEIVEDRGRPQRIGDGLRADMAVLAIAPVFNGVHPERLRPERRPGGDHRGQEPVRGRRRRRDPGRARAAAGARPGRRGGPDAGPGRCRHRAVRHGRGLRHPHAGQGRLQGQHEPDHRRRLLGVGLIPIVAPAFYDEFPTWFSTIFHSGISVGGDHGGAAEPVLQPPHVRPAEARLVGRSSPPTATST